MARTLIERFGFNDPDRKTPLHDRICLWVHEEPQCVIDQALGDFCDGESATNLLNFVQDELGDEGTASIYGAEYECEWEVPIGGKHIAGFIDIRITRQTKIATSLVCDMQTDKMLLQPVITLKSGILNVEVKSQITSVGELLRQIQFYRTFDKKTPWCVVSPDTRHADLIRQQGIHFVEYPRHLVNQTGQTDLF